MRLSITKQDTANVSVFSKELTIVDYNLEVLKDIVCNYKHSFSTFDGLKRKNRNINSTSGIMLDFDAIAELDANGNKTTKVDTKRTMTIEAFRKEYKDLRFFLYTSKSHQKVKYYPEDHKRAGEIQIEECDRFHVFIPFTDVVELLTEEDRRQYKSVLRHVFTEVFPTSDQATKDPARYFFPSPEDGVFIYNVGKTVLDYNTILDEVKKLEGDTDTLIYCDDDEIDENPFKEINTGKGNDYDTRTLAAGLKLLISTNSIPYDTYQRILAWANFEPQEVRELVAGILSSNPEYNDTKEDILTKMDTFEQREITFSTLYKMFKDVNPEFTQADYKEIKRELSEIEKQFKSDLRYDPRDPKKVVEYLNSFMGISVVDGLFYINTTKNGWEGKTDKEAKNLLKPLQVARRDKKGNVKLTDAFTEWLSDPNRRHFNEHIFKYGEETTFNTLNTAPSLEDCPKAVYSIEGESKAQVLLEMIKESLCGGNTHRFDYLTTWAAYVVNHQRTDVAFQLSGAQGTGKSQFSNLLIALIHKEAWKISDKPEDMIEQFNSDLKGKVLWVSEEAIYSGRRDVQAATKNKITSQKLEIKRKFVNGTEKIDNLLNILYLSNHAVTTLLDASDRRHVIYKTATTYVKKTASPFDVKRLEAFWANVASAIKDKAALEYMQYFFQQKRAEHDINWLTNPENQMTEEKDYVVSQSLAPFDAYLVQLFKNGFSIQIDVETQAGYSKTKEYVNASETFLRMESIYENYKSFDSSWKYSNQQKFTSQLKSDGLVIEKRSRSVYGESKRHEHPQRVSCFDKEAISNYLKVQGITAHIEEEPEELEIIVPKPSYTTVKTVEIYNDSAPEWATTDESVVVNVNPLLEDKQPVESIVEPKTAIMEKVENKELPELDKDSLEYFFEHTLYEESEKKAKEAKRKENRKTKH